MLNTLQRLTDETLEEIQEEMRIRKTEEVFLLFSMGSQFDHLIKQMMDRLGVFCLVADPGSVKATDVKVLKPTGIILSGGPASVHSEPPPFDTRIFNIGIPVLGICLGFQMWAKHVGATVRAGEKREFGVHEFSRASARIPFFTHCPESFLVLESHGDQIKLHDSFEILGLTENAPVAAARGKGTYQHLWGVQFHPEVTETVNGEQIFKNFCFEICGAKDVYPARDVATSKIVELRETIGTRKVLLALSGGSDSSVVAYLLKEALGDRVKQQVRAVYIKGIDRPDDEANVHQFFDWLDLRVIDATESFLKVLEGKVAMKEKRLAMRSVYKNILEECARAFGAEFIAQGTLYTDISESGGGYGGGARKAQIKIHHNVNLGFSIPELLPLADCVKDSGRNIGRVIRVPEPLLVRQPFPGPGLVVRIEGLITSERLRIARQIDGIWIEEFRKWGLYKDVWQAGAVVTQSVTTCTKGDDAANGSVVALWAVTSVNGFTAQWARLPYDFLDHVSKRITNEVREVGSVVYRISGKPPSTIEWG